MYPPTEDGQDMLFMVGVKSLQPTTTFRAMELPIEENTFIANVAHASARLIGRPIQDSELDVVYHAGKELLRVAAMFKENEILEFCEHGSIKPRAVMPLYEVRVKE